MEPENTVTVSLPYHPPLDWGSLLGDFRAHQIPGLETVTDEWYERVFRLDGEVGYLRVTQEGGEQAALTLRVVGASSCSLPQIIRRVRRMCDLDMDPAVVGQMMKGQPILAELWQAYPGLRVAHTWDRFETMITTILGQLVSVGFARRLIRELMAGYGERIVHPVTGEVVNVFPEPEVLARGKLAEVRTSDLRRKAIQAMAASVVDGTFVLTGAQDLQALRKRLLAATGIGVWSADYIMMRAFEDADAFPATDYCLKQEIKRHPEMDLRLARPWRAYAAVYLWRRFLDGRAAD